MSFLILRGQRHFKEHQKSFQKKVHKFLKNFWRTAVEFWTLIFGGVRLSVSYAEPVTAASLERSDNKLWR